MACWEERMQSWEERRKREKGSMPRTPLHTLIWSQDHACYELVSFGQVPQPFVPGADEAWQSWLDAQRSFAFRGPQGRLSGYKQAPPRADQSWYARRTTTHR